MATQVKGAVILARRSFAQEEVGETAWGKVLAALSEEDRDLLSRPVLTSNWYPFDVNERLDAAIVKVLGRDDPRIFERIGARSAQQNLGGPHRAFLTPGAPERFLASTDRIYEFYYDTGYREFQLLGPGDGVMTTHEAETFSKTDCLTVIGWYKEALKMCGAAAVSNGACRRTRSEAAISAWVVSAPTTNSSPSRRTPLSASSPPICWYR